MNKQEAIRELMSKSREIIFGDDENVYLSRKRTIEPVSQIDEPQKPVVPKFVAEWLEWCKTNDVTLLGAISPIDELGSAICNDKRVKSLAASRWAERNQDNFARAWLDGYEIEKEE